MPTHPQLRKIAERMAFARVPETCPQVHGAGTEALGKFHAWLGRRPWLAHLTEKERAALEFRIGSLVADVVAGAKEQGTVPLRQALIAEVFENLLLRLPEERLAAIEDGTDAASDLLLNPSLA